MRWWASLALALVGACHGPAPTANPVTAGQSGPAAASSCKVVANPVCDPTVGDETALTLVRRRCAGCHDEGGEASHPFLTAEALSKERADVALRLAGCEMPPDDTPFPAEERTRLMGWGACAPAEGK